MMEKLTSFKIEDDFFSDSKKMKQYFDSRFESPLKATEDRFVWDYWHVPKQYTLVRTLASQFFPEELYASWEQALCQWGQKHLGCDQISSPWLSYYVEGCEQRFHADNPHGPWAFVFSLTDWENRKFRGGETEIMSDQVLNYWEQFEASRGLEEESLLEKIEPLFSRLTVFDPRKPHGVRQVFGEADPRRARIVLHGWFLEPQPFVEGGLKDFDLGPYFSSELSQFLDKVESQEQFYSGLLTTRVKIDTSGIVTGADIIVNTLKSTPHESANLQELEKGIQMVFENLKFPVCDKESELTLPLIFR